MSHDARYTQTADGWIETHSGRRFFFEDPTPDMIDIGDVAQALSKLCRYNGHCRRFYTVAEHSVVLSDWRFSRPSGADGGQTPQDVEEAFALLMHDAGEAYLCDIPRPIKARLPDYKVLEAKIDRAIALKFGLEYPHPPFVKQADGRIIVDERDQVMGPRVNDWNLGDLKPLGVTISGWEPAVAYVVFLNRFNGLRELRGQS